MNYRILLVISGNGYINRYYIDKNCYNNQEVLFNAVCSQKDFFVGNVLTSLCALTIYMLFFVLYMQYKVFSNEIVKKRFLLCMLVGGIEGLKETCCCHIINYYSFMFLCALLPIFLFNYNYYWKMNHLLLNLLPYIVVMTVLNIVLYKGGFYSNKAIFSPSPDGRSQYTNNRLDIVLLFNIPYLLALTIQMIRWRYVLQNVNTTINTPAVVLELCNLH